MRLMTPGRDPFRAYPRSPGRQGHGCGLQHDCQPQGAGACHHPPQPTYSKLVMGDEAFQKMFQSKQRFFVLRYMLHSRLNDAGTAFEKETNLVGETIGFEGVGAVAVHQDRLGPRLLGGTNRTWAGNGA